MGRRYWLIASTSAASAVGVMGAAVPFVKSWLPSAKARAAGAPARIDIARLRPGEVLRPIPAWRGQPVFVVGRTVADIALLERENANLADANSENTAKQPQYARNAYRSRRPEIGVFLVFARISAARPRRWTKRRCAPLTRTGRAVDFIALATVRASTWRAGS